MPYRPRMAPSAADPLTEAIAGLREGWRSSAEARRQRQLDQERQEDRQFLRDMQRRAQEDREFAQYGQRLVSAPPTVREEIDVTALNQQLLDEARRQFAARRAAPRPAAAGAYVPGQGFALPRPMIDLQGAGPQLQAPQMRPAVIDRPDPRYEEFAPGRFGRRDLLPDERAAARVRQLEEERMARLAEALSGLEHIPEPSRRALALGVPASVALPPARASEPGRLIQTDQGWAFFDPATRQATPIGVGLPPARTGTAASGVTATTAFAQRARLAHSYLNELRDIDRWWRELYDDEREDLGGDGYLEQLRRQAGERFGFASPAEAQATIRRAESGRETGAQSPEEIAADLMAQGLSDDEIIAELRRRGIIED